MPASVRYYTDPACSVSWGCEPMLRRLMVEFGDDLRITYVMGGLAREYSGDLGWLVEEWLEQSDRFAMPFDPRLWIEGPIASTYPACMAVKAAAQQSADGGEAYLRSVREGLMCFRRKLDTAEALVEEARRVGLDSARFRIDLESHATVVAFGADLEATRSVPDEARERGGVKQLDGSERLVFPTLCAEGEGGERRWVFAAEPYEAWRDAIAAVGGQEVSGDRPGVLEALQRFGRMAATEVEAVCDLPGPRAHAELWALAQEWRVKPVRVLGGWLFEPA